MKTFIFSMMCLGFIAGLSLHAQNATTVTYAPNPDGTVTRSVTIPPPAIKPAKMSAAQQQARIAQLQAIILAAQTELAGLQTAIAQLPAQLPVTP